MKKLLKILLILLLILVIAMFAIGKKYHFEKSVVINAPAEKIYPLISSTKAFNTWNPWMKLDPNMKVTYSGNSGEVGDKYCWDSKNDDAGAGCQEITALVPNQKQSTKMLFTKPFESDAYSNIILTPEGNGTKVTWDLDSELDYPMNLMSIFMDGQMDKSYGEGLENLKKLAEK